MKRILTLALLFGIALFASSCKKEVTEVIQPNQTVFREVRASDWVLKTDQQTGAKTWSATLGINQLDEYIHDNGGVLVYASFDNGVYEQIPQVYNGIAYSMSYVPRAIQLDAQLSDYTNDDISQPGDVSIKIVLIDSVP
ncbi:hypothetical protein LT679_10625 [Mucilaginibacter roseus]|uniref:Uncharacterized protein n=1 Tax=Mucilaginibacter roseus TaxID=1528868 RepID=A0ABS8U1Q8_9SPHI|nr:hypothetical protein [Mucilaginibacter roseus]MCD8741056.1 hypothetical protein [Mucilaginibacter roseus]